MYSLKFNNGQSINLTQWRDDCKSNPIESHGTWDESRNGWCPGSVEPGAVVDITNHMTPVTKGAATKSPLRNDGAQQSVTLDILVFDKDSQKYEPFSNIKGWIFGDKSILKVELSLHVYSSSAYNAAMNKFIRCSSAEAAMHHEGRVYGDETAATHTATSLKAGSTRNFIQKGMEQAPEHVKRSLKVITQGKPPALAKAAAPKEDENPWAAAASCWKFKHTAPWYETHSTGLEDLIAKGMATRVPVLQKVYMEGSNRYTTIPIYLDAIKDKDFTQVGLQMKLEKPDGMEYDHWDRVGSVGLEFYKSTASAHVHSKKDTKPKPLDDSLVDAKWDGAHSLISISGLLVALLACFA
jgi:hypothetical protein